MSLAKKILGKDLQSLVKEDIESYFTQPREETSILEFKSGEAKVNSIFKELCAFLNTEGGLLIIGTPKEQKVGKAGKRICKGRIVPSHFQSKEWLYSLITANIVPIPKDLTIHEMQAEGGKLFVIEVEQSKNPPHQFLTDGRYYIRMKQEARPASHGIVEALFFKNRAPRLIADLQINPSERGAENFNDISIDIINDSRIPTDQVSYYIQIMNIEEVKHNGDLKPVVNGNASNFEIEGSIEKVLVDERKFPLDFEIINKQEPFVISILLWNKNSSLFKLNALFDPMNFFYIEKNQTGDNQVKNVKELYDQLLELKSNLY
jgi:hypothetical protein